MFLKKLSSRLCAVVLFAIAFSLTGLAQKPPEAAGKLRADLVKTGLYVIYGGGSNSLLRLTANGVIIVDGKLPGSYDALRAQVRRISDQPVRVLINTDYHDEHTGNNARFRDTGTGILAQENVKSRLAAKNPPDGGIALPTKTYDSEFTVRGGQIEVEVLHFGNAHTDGDSVVYFRDLKVVAVGDLFAAAPNPDYAAGGSLLRWGSVLEQILKLDFDVVVPGTGPMVTRADLEAFKARIDSLVSLSSSLVEKGVPEDRLMSQLTAGDPGGLRLNFTQAELDRFYAELSHAK